MEDIVDRIRILCGKYKTSITKIEQELGYANGTIGKWKTAKRRPPLEKVLAIAERLGTTTDYLYNGAEAERSYGLTEKDRRDIAKLIENIMDDMEKGGDLNFDGVPMSDEARAAMASAMKVGLEEARRRNKETYTPKKFRKE